MRLGQNLLTVTNGSSYNTIDSYECKKIYKMGQKYNFENVFILKNHRNNFISEMFLNFCNFFKCSIWALRVIKIL
jgi:hypothetical protein